MRTDTRHIKFSIKYLQIFLVLASIFCLNYTAYAQQDAGFSHYMYNTLAINPAYAGSRNSLTITALHRSQWVGFDGAPSTETLTTHLPVLKNHAGVGLSIVSDRIGYVNSNSAFADFSYRLKIDKTQNFFFGMKFGVNFRQAKFTQIELDNPADPDFAFDYKSSWLPNIGLGAYYVNDKFYAGISVPKLLENDLEPISVVQSSKSGEHRHFYLISGYLHKLNRDWKMRTTALFRATRYAPLMFDVSTQFIYNDKFWLGGMVRVGDAVGLLAGMTFTKQIRAGYAFDFSYANQTVRYNAGSHELFLDYIFDSGKDKLCPAY